MRCSTWTHAAVPVGLPDEALPLSHVGATNISYSLAHICTAEPAHSSQDTQHTVFTIPYTPHICCPVPNAHVPTSHTTWTVHRVCTCVHTPQHMPHNTHLSPICTDTVDTVAPTRLYIHSPSGLLSRRSAWLCCPAKNLLLVIHCHHGLQKERDRLREKPTHAELWGPSKKPDHLTEISTPPLI